MNLSAAISQDGRAVLAGRVAGAVEDISDAAGAQFLAARSLKIGHSNDAVHCCCDRTRMLGQRWRSAQRPPWRRLRTRRGRSSWRAAGALRRGRRCGCCLLGGPPPDRELPADVTKRWMSWRATLAHSNCRSRVLTRPTAAPSLSCVEFDLVSQWSSDLDVLGRTQGARCGTPLGTGQLAGSSAFVSELFLKLFEVLQPH